MSEIQAGSCLCGRVQFEIEGPFERFYLCYCAHCRKDTGSAHAANLFSSVAHLRWKSGQDCLASFTLPGTRHERAFCANCGSALPYLAGAMLVVPAGSLDTEVRLKPDARIFCASRAAWTEDLEKLPSFGKFPA